MLRGTHGTETIIRHLGGNEFRISISLKEFDESVEQDERGLWMVARQNVFIPSRSRSGGFILEATARSLIGAFLNVEAVEI